MFMNVVAVAVLNRLVLVVTTIAIPIHVNMVHVNRTHSLPPVSSASVTKAGLENTVNTDHVTTSRATIKVSQLITVTQINANAVVQMESVVIIVK